jgi:ubiquinone/menaquinone biosynthesis C-methylase UbiE
VSGPDARLAVEKYRRRARTYDREVERSSRRLRERAVERLRLRRGEVVFDVGCGTGLSFGLLRERVGPEGAVIGLDVSSDMLAAAQERIGREGWANVALIEGTAERARLPVPGDAALLVLTSDVMRSEDALRNVLGQLRPGGRVAVAGVKWATPAWAAPLNIPRRLRARPYRTTFEGRKRPWDILERLVPRLTVDATSLGGTYVAWGEWHP